MILYFLLTDNMEGSSFKGYNFMHCGPNLCRRMYLNELKISDGTRQRHYRSSLLFNSFMIIVSILPAILETLGQSLLGFISPIFTSLSYVLFFILGNEIVTDDMIMGSDTERFHLTARYLLWAPMLLPIFLLIVEVSVYLYFQKKLYDKNL